MSSTNPQSMSTPDALEAGRDQLLLDHCSLGHLRNVKEILAWGTDPNGRGQDYSIPITLRQVPPILIAIENGSAPIVQCLIDAGAKVNVMLPGGFSPLHAAARSRMPDAVQIVVMLLENGASASVFDTAGMRGTPLHWAASEGHADICNVICEAGSDLVDLKAPKGDTPLIVACRAGHIAVANVLLDHGANCNISNVRQLTPLLAAAQIRDPDVAFNLIKLLLMFGADPNALSRCRLAVRVGIDSDILKYLRYEISRDRLKLSTMCIRMMQQHIDMFPKEFLEKNLPKNILDRYFPFCDTAVPVDPFGVSRLTPQIDDMSSDEFDPMYLNQVTTATRTAVSVSAARPGSGDYGYGYGGGSGSPSGPSGRHIQHALFCTDEAALCDYEPFEESSMLSEDMAEPLDIEYGQHQRQRQHQQQFLYGGEGEGGEGDGDGEGEVAGGFSLAGFKGSMQLDSST